MESAKLKYPELWEFISREAERARDLPDFIRGSRQNEREPIRDGRDEENRGALTIECVSGTPDHSLQA